MYTINTDYIKKYALWARSMSITLIDIHKYINLSKLMYQVTVKMYIYIYMSPNYYKCVNYGI